MRKYICLSRKENLRYSVTKVGNEITKVRKITWFVRKNESQNEGLLRYHCFRWYATFENKTPAEKFPKFPSIMHVTDRSDRNPPITAWRKECQKVTLVVVIGGFRSDLSITCMIDGNFGNVSAGVLRSEERRVGKECRSRWSPYH